MARISVKDKKDAEIPKQCDLDDRSDGTGRGLPWPVEPVFCRRRERRDVPVLSERSAAVGAECAAVRAVCAAAVRPDRAGMAGIFAGWRGLPRLFVGGILEMARAERTALRRRRCGHPRGSADRRARVHHGDVADRGVTASGRARDAGAGMARAREAVPPWKSGHDRCGFIALRTRIFRRLPQQHALRPLRGRAGAERMVGQRPVSVARRHLSVPAQHPRRGAEGAGRLRQAGGRGLAGGI